MQAVHAGKLNSLLLAPDVEEGDARAGSVSGRPATVNIVTLKRVEEQPWGMGLNPRHEVCVQSMLL
jgi:hypothetical protein